MDFNDFYLYLLLGAFAGVSAGLLGIGGGLIIVPALVWIFHQQGIDSTIIMHLALGTSLASIVFTSLSSIWAHHQKKAVIWRVFWKLSPGIIFGAWLGAAIVHFLPTQRLTLLFGLFELYVALQMTINIKPKPQRQLPQNLGMTATGGGIGFISAMMGIGGGTLTVPFLVWCNIHIRKAIATSAACGLPIAIAGSIGFLLTGWEQTNRPEYSLGYLYLPALLGIVMTSVLFAPVGAWLTHYLATGSLKKVFALLLYILAAKMLLL